MPQDTDTQQEGINIDTEPLFGDSLLARTQNIWQSHRTDATDKEDFMLCETWLKIGQDPVCGGEQMGGAFRGGLVLFP
jgi:hypothetical protein